MAQPTITVKNAAGADVTLFTISPAGRAADSDSQSVALSAQDAASLGNIDNQTGATALATQGIETATQTTASTLATIDGKTPAQGRKAAAASSPAVLSTEDKAVVDAIAASLATQINVRSPLAYVGGTVTRPADTTPYAVNDVIGTAVTGVTTIANAFRTNGNSGYVVKVKLQTDQAACIAQFRVHLFQTAPAAVADNAPMPILYADASRYIGFVDVPAVVQEGAGSTSAFGLWTGQLSANADAASTSLFAVIQTKTVFTPASAQNFDLRITVDQN